MNYLVLSIVFLPFIAAPLSFFLKEKARSFFTVFTCAVIFILNLGLLITGAEASASLLSFNFAINGFNAAYGLITSFMWLCASMLSVQYFEHHHNLRRYFLFFLITLGATTAVFFAEDLITTFVFFEIMSFTSYTWVIQERTKEALSAGKTYIAIAVFGGMVCLMGLFMLYNITGTLVIAELPEALKTAEKSKDLYIAAFCMLTGFGAKAGLFPLHIWLPKAHPVAPAPASALLSGVLTKTGIFGMLVITSKILYGDLIWSYTILFLGTVTMVLGAVLAVFSVNLKRTLACSSLSQIGFITVGVAMLSLLGEENALAANGTALYMMNHSLVKLVLFLSAGAVYMGAHTLDLNKLKGYGRNKPVLMICFLTGSLSLAGIPGLLGYISKTLVHESIVEFAHHGGWYITLVEWLFLFSGGLTAAYMTKLFVAIFIEKPTTETPKGKKLSILSSASIILSAVGLPVLGLLPHSVTEKISLSMIDFINGHHFHHEVHYLAFENIKGVLISVSIGVIVYFLFIRKVLMKDENGTKYYINPLENRFSVEENIYKPLYRITIHSVESISSILDKSTDILIKAGLNFISIIAKILCDITDILIYLASISVFSPAKEKEEIPHRFSYRVGAFFDKYIEHPVTEEESKSDLFASVSETISRTTHRLSGSFSFSLFMTCFGICLILLFLIFAKK